MAMIQLTVIPHRMTEQHAQPKDQTLYVNSRMIRVIGDNDGAVYVDCEGMTRMYVREDKRNLVERINYFATS